MKFHSLKKNFGKKYANSVVASKVAGKKWIEFLSRYLRGQALIWGGRGVDFRERIFFFSDPPNVIRMAYVWEKKKKREVEISAQPLPMTITGPSLICYNIYTVKTDNG